MVGMLVLVGAALALAPADASLEEAARPRCCFTNPGYSGVCEVRPSEDETCASVLSYLNNQASSGKSYCGSSDVRGGWEQVSCKPAASPDVNTGSGSSRRPQRSTGR
jgi:hypothetical protein